MGNLLKKYGTGNNPETPDPEALGININAELILKATSSLVAVMDREYRFIYVSPSHERLLGYSPEDLLGRTSLDFVHHEDRDRLAAVYAQTLSEKLDNIKPEPFRIFDKNDRIRHIRISFDVVRDRLGNPDKIICISDDITKQQETSEDLRQKTIELENTVSELRRTQRRMIEQERQLALSQMASGIAHDFNNSLTSIQGFSDLLLQIPEKMSDVDTVREYISLINSAARNAAQIVKRLQKFYRPAQDERVEPVDIKTLIEESVALTRPVWQSKAQERGAFITIEKELDDQAAAAGKHAELQEVVTNLIFNAVDAMPEGGTIRFVARRENGQIILEISDTGIGMDATVLKQCLDPFYTTKGEAGSGLGLPTVQAIITRHQGQLDIRSQPGRGTTLIITLPAAKYAKPQAAADKKKHPPYPPLRILIVDDEEHQRHLLKEYLGKDRHLTETAVNGADGLRKFNRNRYDLVITDQAMPELNGDALARNIKKEHPEKPIIMLTGFADMLEPGGKKPEAVDLLISKPVSLNQLREAIRQVLPAKKHDR